jgi:anthranilate synthase/aminodeoxychorismate synthase-like glutamine amidotransferase
MILLIDNYDSFVHNLARYFARLGQDTLVLRNDETNVDEIRYLRPAAVVLSPGPCGPDAAGNAVEIARALMQEVPLLGVCLGHQIIAQALGARIVRAPRPVHGQTSQITHDGTRLFAKLPSPITVCRYHSLVVEPTSLPPELLPTAWTDDGLLMAFQHADYPVFGVQFHPEAILTERGFDLVGNFLHLAGMPVSVDTLARATAETTTDTPRASLEPLPLNS